jgi:type IV pilus assembly protein PilV
MNWSKASRRYGSGGFTLIEVMVSLVILLLGMLSLAGFQNRLFQSEMEAYQRTQAQILVQDMADRMRVHRAYAACFQNLRLGTGSSEPPACTYNPHGTKTLSEEVREQMVQQQKTVQADQQAWNDLLLGAAEQAARIRLGAMAGAVGCIDYIGSDAAGTDIFRISVAWQGVIETAAPPRNLQCGQNSFGDETLRRVSSITVGMAKQG